MGMSVRIKAAAVSLALVALAVYLVEPHLRRTKNEVLMGADFPWQGCVSFTRKECREFFPEFGAPIQHVAVESSEVEPRNSSLGFEPMDLGNVSDGDGWISKKFKAGDVQVRWTQETCEWSASSSGPWTCLSRRQPRLPRVILAHTAAIALALVLRLVIFDSTERSSAGLSPVDVNTPDEELRRRVAAGSSRKVEVARCGRAMKYFSLSRAMQVIAIFSAYGSAGWSVKPKFTIPFLLIARIVPTIAVVGFSSIREPINFVVLSTSPLHALPQLPLMQKLVNLWLTVDPLVIIGGTVRMISGGADYCAFLNLTANITAIESIGRIFDILSMVFPLLVSLPALANITFVACLAFGKAVGVGIGASACLLWRQVLLNMRLDAMLVEVGTLSESAVLKLWVALLIAPTAVGVCLAWRIFATIAAAADEQDCATAEAVAALAVQRLKAAARRTDEAPPAGQTSVELLLGGGPSLEATGKWPKGTEPEVLVTGCVPESCMKRVFPRLSFKSGAPGGLAMSVALVCLDMVSDFNQSTQLMGQGHFWFGIFLAAPAYMGLVAQIAQGLWHALPVSLAESAIAGVMTSELFDLFDSEREEAVLSFALTVYTVPYAELDSPFGLASLVLSAVLSLKGLVVYAVEKVDLTFEAQREGASAGVGAHMASVKADDGHGPRP